MDINCTTGRLSDLQTSSRLQFLIRNEQILHFLVVDFEHRKLDLVLGILRLICLTLRNSRENLIASNRHNTLIGSITNHGVTLTRAGLPVREQAAVIAFPGVVEHLPTEGLVHLLLIRILALSILLTGDTISVLLESVVGPETVIEGESLVLARLRINKLSRWSLHLDATFGIAFDFSIVEGPDPNRNFNTHFLISMVY